MRPKQVPWMRVFVMSLVTSACLTLFGMQAGSKSADAQTELDSNMRKWASKEIKDYKYTFQWICFCAPDYTKPVSISVKNGAIDAVNYRESGQPVERSKFERYRTVEGLFQLIQDAIKKKPHEIKVAYDAELGYPSSAFVDYEANIADEETRFEIKSLVVSKRD